MKVIAINAILFSMLVIFQLFTGIYMFFIRYGFSPSKEIFNKSLHSLIEVAFPHFLAISITIFIILHLFYFFKITKKHFILTTVSFISGWLDIVSSFIIVLNKNLYFIKVLSFITFEISFCIACILLIIAFKNKLT